MARSRNMVGAAGPVAGSVAAWVPAAVLALALCYFVVPNPRLDFSRFDLRDAESYLALSRALVTGVGYTRNLDPQYFIPHTTWPPGLPVMLMPAVALAGMPVDLTVVKLGMIGYGALGILLAHVYARRLSRSLLVRLGMPLLLALDPQYWLFSRMVLTEVPTVVWALVALLLADIGWARGEVGMPRAFAFGLVAGCGLLIRGSFFGALFLPLAYLFVLRRERCDWRGIVSWCVYAAAFVIPFTLWHVRCSHVATPGLGQDGIDQLAMLFRANPVYPDSPLRSLPQVASDIRITAASAIEMLPRALVPGLWSGEAWEWLGTAAGPFAAAVTLCLLAVSFAARRNLPIILLYGSMAALNLFYAAGAMARLWVPVTALVALSLPLGLERLSLLSGRAAAWGGAAVGMALAANLAFFISEHETRPYRDSTYAALVDLFLWVRGSGPLDGNVLTPDPQAFALVTGSHAPMPRFAIGVDPDYSYVVLPSRERTERLGGTVLHESGIWSLVKLEEPIKATQLRARIDCKTTPVPAFAVVAGCPIW